VFYNSNKYEGLEVEDRVGGGDGFCSGTIYGFLNSHTPQECVNLGAAHGALAQSTRGDTSMVTIEEVMHVMKGGTARIQR
jgi:2-dehydro-3-deoxygluconokinase